MAMTSEEFRTLLDVLAPQTAEAIKNLVAEWDESGSTERGLIQLKGPVLSVTVQKLRQLLEGEDPSADDVQTSIGWIDKILRDEEMVLAGAAAVGVGVLRTS